MKRIACLALMSACSTLPSYDDPKQSIRARSGEKFVIRLAGSSDCVAPEYRFYRLDPKTEGDAVRLIRKEAQERPGHGVHETHVFYFETLQPGGARILFSRQMQDDRCTTEQDQTYVVRVD